MVDDRPTVVKTGSSTGLIVLAIAILIAAGVAFMFYQSQSSKDNAVAGAATAVGDTAKKVGDAVDTEAK